jgi:hypothetical protein
MDFDNLQSVTSSVSDTLPFEAISITGRYCFWDGSVPNPLVSVGSPTMSVSSIMPEPSGAGARVGSLAGPVPSKPKVGIPTLSTVTHTVSRPVIVQSIYARKRRDLEQIATEGFLGSS